jgi:molecular chaperone GrpE
LPSPVRRHNKIVVATADERSAELEDRLLRLAAEFDNWKKRIDREQAEAERRGRDAVLVDLLAVVDALESALASVDANAEAAKVRDGIALVLRDVRRRLERHGVSAIDATGRKFDPRIHEALARVPSRDVESGVVMDELRKGYMSGDRLLRPAAVVVAETPAEGAAGEGTHDGTPGV